MNRGNSCGHEAGLLLMGIGLLSEKVIERLTPKIDTVAKRFLQIDMCDRRKEHAT